MTVQQSITCDNPGCLNTEPVPPGYARPRGWLHLELQTMDERHSGWNPKADLCGENCAKEWLYDHSLQDKPEQAVTG